MLRLDEFLFKGSVDLVIAHPPYYSSIQYGELSFLWAVWLGLEVPFKEEIVSNLQQFTVFGNRLIRKDDAFFERKIRKAFQKLYELLRSHGVLCIIFNSRSRRRRENFVRCISDAGFKIIEMYKCPQLYSQRQGLSKFIKENLIIVCEKS